MSDTDGCPSCLDYLDNKYGSRINDNHFIAELVKEYGFKFTKTQQNSEHIHKCIIEKALQFEKDYFKGFNVYTNFSQTLSSKLLDGKVIIQPNIAHITSTVNKSSHRNNKNSKLYGEIVLDTEKEKQHKNTRKKNEIELRKQLFLILDTESHLLYLSDIAKKGAIKTYFSEELQADIIIKNLYSSLDEFQKSVKILKKLKFTQYRNISNTLDKESIFMQQANELGLDMPEKIMMQIEYPNTFIGDLKNGIQILKKKKDQGYFNDIILIGEDDFGIEQSFDFTSVIKNIEIAVRKNEDDRYDENEVERSFFEKIR